MYFCNNKIHIHMELPIGKKAFDILKTYKGTNDYILYLQKEYWKNKHFLPTAEQAKYIVKNHNIEPNIVNANYYLSKPCRQFVMEQLNLVAPIENIYVHKILTRRGDLLHIYGASVNEPKHFDFFYVSKNCIKLPRPTPDIDLSKYAHRPPLPHQVEGIKTLMVNKKHILAYDMGLGKSITAIIAAIEGKYKKILIVCPASLKYNWKKEISFYENPDNISMLSSSDFQLKKWNIINYDVLHKFHHTPQRGVKISDLPISYMDYAKFDLVIADEGHYLKQSSSKRSKIFADFASRIPSRWLLTGTPITNRPVDLYHLLHICESPMADNWVYFIKKYCKAKRFNRKGQTKKYWDTSGASNLSELRDFSSEYILRKLKHEVLNLPPKTIEPIYVPLEYSVKYNAYMEDYYKWSENAERLEEKPKIGDHLAQLMKIRQLLSYDKTDYTINIAEDLIEEGHKIIIFSCFTESIRKIYDHFGKSSVIIDGSVSKEKRNIAVEGFQNNDNIKVFCGNIIAAGVGLTLTEGTIVIFNDIDWVPTNHLQASDRSHRIGQEKPVHVIYPLFDNTLDTLMFDSLQNKMSIITKIMGDDANLDDFSVAKDVIAKLAKKT